MVSGARPWVVADHEVALFQGLGAILPKHMTQHRAQWATEPGRAVRGLRKQACLCVKDRATIVADIADHG